MPRHERIALIGGAGFIGASLAERLVADQRVLIIDNLHRNALRQNPLLRNRNLRLIKADILKPHTFAPHLRGVNTIVHLASIAGVDTVVSHPVKTMEVALVGTYNVLKAIKKPAALRRFVFFSTSEIYGPQAAQVKETDPATIGPISQPRWTYAAAKYAAEHLVMNWARQHQADALTIRPFNVFGPRQVGIGAIHTFIRRALAGEDILLNNAGTSVRSWCYIDDFIDGLLRCLSVKAAKGHAFNLGNPDNTVRTRTLAQTVVALTGSKSRILKTPQAGVDVRTRIPDITLAKNILGFCPRIDLETGLTRTIEWYRRQKDKGTP